MTTYQQFMQTASKLVGERSIYGDIEAGLDRVATLMGTITGIHLTSREVALVLHCVKLARIYENPEKPDHYLDGANYLAFAGVANAREHELAQKNQPEPAPIAVKEPLKPLNLGERIVQNALVSVD